MTHINRDYLNHKGPQRNYYNNKKERAELSSLKAQPSPLHVGRVLNCTTATDPSGTPLFADSNKSIKHYQVKEGRIHALVRMKSV